MTRPGKHLRRRPPQRTEKTTILIVGEGKNTETFYFNGLKSDCDHSRYAVKVVSAHGGSLWNIAEKAVLEAQSANYHEVWIVWDADRQKIEDFETALSYAKQGIGRKKAKFCTSNPCFEVWILAHFKRTSAAFDDCAHATKAVSDEWKSHNLSGDYGKSTAGIYGTLKPLLSQAVDNAKAVHQQDHRKSPTHACNSSTEVYKLVERLLPVS